MFGKHTASEAEAEVVAVEMTERLSYGEAKVRVTYSVRPLDRPAFQAVRDAKVAMRFLPQAGQRVQVRYDGDTRSVLDVLTPPGQEGPPPAGSVPTAEIPWRDGGRANWWANGTRRS